MKKSNIAQILICMAKSSQDMVSMLATLGEKISLTKSELTKLLSLLKYHDTAFTLYTKMLVQHNTHELRELLSFFLLKILHETKLSDNLVKNDDISEGSKDAKHEAFKTDSLDIMAEIIEEKRNASVKDLSLKEEALSLQITSRMYEDLGVLNSLRTLLHFFKLASRPVEKNLEELYCLWKLSGTSENLNHPELTRTVAVNQYHPTPVKVDLGNKFTNWTIAQTNKNESYSCVLFRNDNSTGFIQKMMGTKPEKFNLHASTKASLAPLIKDGESNNVYLKYGIYQTGLTMMNKRPNYERLCDLLHSGYVKGSEYFTGMVDAKDDPGY